MTPSASLGQYFVYNATYHILICKTCQYAVQKTALKSHLLRHRIYREDQRRLLSSLAKLTLPEPDDIELPPPGSPPIEHLATFSGWRCSLPNCRHLCVSTKRMKHHWREEHSEISWTESDMVATCLQTFFRGTKVRYFEVRNQSPLVEKADAVVPVSSASLGKQDSRISAVPRQRRTLDLELPTVDLDVLRYFHHFVTTTCHSLPHNIDNDEEFWQKAVVPKALQLQWLMFGILAISAHHIVSSLDEAVSQRSSRIHALRYARQFQTGWVSYKRQNQPVDSQGYKSGARIACLLQCHHWAIGVLDVSALSTGQRINLVLQNLQSCGGSTEHVSKDEISNVESCALLEPVHGHNTFQQETSPRNPTEILDVIQSLPRQLALLLGRPKDMQDVHAILNAIALLSDVTLKCISAGESWEETVQWLHNTTNHFRILLIHENVAALVILSCWLMIFEHVEQRYWICHGMSASIGFLLQEALPSDPKVLDMVGLFR